MTSEKDWERIVLPQGHGDPSVADLVASIDAIELGARPGGELLLLDHSAIRLTEQIFLHDDEAPRRALLARGQHDPAFAARLMANILPQVARRLETGWGEDRLSFVDVTIAAARLQDAVRIFGRIALPSPEAASVALIVPPWEQHTLAAAFAAQAMRDLGAHVRIVTGPSTGVIASILARAPIQAIMVSISGEAARERAPDLLASLRQATSRALPIVVGGAAAIDATESLCPRGADLMTNNFSKALGFCKIPLSPLKGELAATNV
ncbi:MAG: hypothetical protein AAF366_09375 [Pseudomonadota bacterium]